MRERSHCMGFCRRVLGWCGLRLRHEAKDTVLSSKEVWDNFPLVSFFASSISYGLSLWLEYTLKDIHSFRKEFKKPFLVAGDLMVAFEASWTVICVSTLPSKAAQSICHFSSIPRFAGPQTVTFICIEMTVLLSTWRSGNIKTAVKLNKKLPLYCWPRKHSAHGLLERSSGGFVVAAIWASLIFTVFLGTMLPA